VKPSTDDKAIIEELEAWIADAADGPRRLKFLKLLTEFFDLTSLSLIVRAADKSKVLPKRKRAKTA
jgi:hypothetical protein